MIKISDSSSKSQGENIPHTGVGYVKVSKWNIQMIPQGRGDPEKREEKAERQTREE